MSEEGTGSVAPPGAEEDATAGPPPDAMAAGAARSSVPGDTDDTRGQHLRSLLTNVWVLGTTWVLAIAALIVVGAQVNFGIGAAAAGGVLLLALIGVWALATSRAAGDFYSAYADGRGLARTPGRSSLAPATPLLQRGDRRYTRERFDGTLPGGVVGSLCHYTFEEDSTDSKGNSETTHYNFTIALTELPDTAPFIGELALQRRAGFRFLDSAEDVFRTRQRVEVESELADRKFEIFIGKGDDMNRARQVFTPTFIVWLGEAAHEGLAFELSAGALAVNAKGHLKTARELDEFCESAAVIARRLHEEATE